MTPCLPASAAGAPQVSVRVRGVSHRPTGAPTRRCLRQPGRSYRTISFPEQLLGISWEVPGARPVKSRCGYRTPEPQVGNAISTSTKPRTTSNPTGRLLHAPGGCTVSTRKTNLRCSETVLRFHRPIWPTAEHIDHLFREKRLRKKRGWDHERRRSVHSRKAVQP